MPVAALVLRIVHSRTRRKGPTQAYLLVRVRPRMATPEKLKHLYLILIDQGVWPQTCLRPNHLVLQRRAHGPTCAW
jgi:hypothetical protein